MQFTKKELKIIISFCVFIDVLVYLLFERLKLQIYLFCCFCRLERFFGIWVNNSRTHCESENYTCKIIYKIISEELTQTLSRYGLLCL